MELVSEALSQRIERQLPYLRRYAHALMRSPQRGDELVIRAVQAALADPTRFETKDLRIRLYGMLNRLADELGIDALGAVPPFPIERALAALPEPSRRMYLLVGLEQLSLEEAAQALGIDPDEAAPLLERAQEHMRNQLTGRILVVEDEALVALDLLETISGMGHVPVGAANNKRDALAMVDAEQPSLVLMDIRLAQGDSGIETALEIKQRHQVPIIFVTGYARDLERMDLTHLGPVVTKPFTHETIRRAITAAVFAGRPPEALVR